MKDQGIFFPRDLSNRLDESLGLDPNISLHKSPAGGSAGADGEARGPQVGRADVLTLSRDYIFFFGLYWVHAGNLCSGEFLNLLPLDSLMRFVDSASPACRAQRLKDLLRAHPITKTFAPWRIASPLSRVMNPYSMSKASPYGSTELSDRSSPLSSISSLVISTAQLALLMLGPWAFFATLTWALMGKWVTWKRGSF